MKVWKVPWKTRVALCLQYSDFIVENPSDHMVIMQVVSLALYPNPQIIVDLLSDK